MYVRVSLTIFGVEHAISHSAFSIYAFAMRVAISNVDTLLIFVFVGFRGGGEKGKGAFDAR